jgi:hypothetical protein
MMHAALREKSEPSPTVPAEHLVLVEEAIASAQDRRLREFTAADWSRLRKHAHDTAACT